MLTKGNDAYKLKIIAIIGMAIQHSVIVLGDIVPVGFHFPMQLAGGLTFPIMAFLLVEGYRYTSNIKKYLLRLLGFGVIAQVPHMLAFGVMDMGFGFMFAQLNVMFTLLYGLLMVLLHDRMKTRWLF